MLSLTVTRVKFARWFNVTVFGPTLGSYRTFRSTINRLVGKLDVVVAAELAGELGIRRPW